MMRRARTRIIRQADVYHTHLLQTAGTDSDLRDFARKAARGSPKDLLMTIILGGVMAGYWWSQSENVLPDMDDNDLVLVSWYSWTRVLIQTTVGPSFSAPGGSRLMNALAKLVRISQNQRDFMHVIQRIHPNDTNMLARMLVSILEGMNFRRSCAVHQARLLRELPGGMSMELLHSDSGLSETTIASFRQVRRMMDAADRDEEESEEESNEETHPLRRQR